MSLELRQQRILPITIGRNTYRYTVRPVTREEWLQYFDSVTVEEENVNGSIIRKIESTGARLELLGKVLLDVEGYQTPDEKPITEVENWRDLLSISHRLAFADLLFECGLDPKANDTAMLGAESVTLRARWSQDPTGKGIVEHGGLRHIFRVPSIAQQRSYSREASRSRISGGRKGKTEYLGAQRTLVQLYDELIVRVEGYSVDGTLLESDRDRIVLHMDTFHKAQAMGQVFAPAAEPDLQDTEA